MDPFTIISALSALYGATQAGKGQSAAMSGQNALLQQIAQMYGANAPQVIEQLWKVFRQGSTTADIMAQRNLEGDTQGYARQLMEMNYLNNALAGRRDSSQMGQGNYRAAELGANMLAQGRAGIMQGAEARRMQALQAILGGVSGNVGTAVQGYGNLAGMYGQQGAAMGGILGQLGTLFGLKGNERTTTPPDDPREYNQNIGGTGGFGVPTPPGWYSPSEQFPPPWKLKVPMGTAATDWIFNPPRPYYNPNR